MSRLFQYLTYPFIWLISKIFWKIEIQNAASLQNVQGPLIIIANHIGMYDSFLLRLVTSYKNLPIRFMGVKKFQDRHLRFLKKIGIVDLAYALFGVFEVFPGRGLESNLRTPRRILKKGGVIFIFPEGAINRSGTLLPFKRGAAALAVSTGVPVLPLIFRELRGSGFRTRLLIRIGTPFTVPPDESYASATDRLERAVALLYAKRLRSSKSLAALPTSVAA